MIYEQTNILNFINNNIAEYRTWLIAQYAAKSITVTIPDLQGTSINDKLGGQMFPCLYVLDGGKDIGTYNPGNAYYQRPGTFEIYIVDRVIDQCSAENTILLYGEILEQMFIDVANGFKSITDIRSVQVGSWTPFELAVQDAKGIVKTFKAGRQSITAYTYIFPRRI